MTRKNLSGKVGVGLRPTHYPYLLERPETKVDFFEVITENYLNTHGRPLKVLSQIACDYPLSFHGVALSIASPDEIDFHYLERLRLLIHDFRPFLVSDHLCFTGANNTNTHNLLPFPFNKESLNRITKKIDQVQNYLDRIMTFENLSAYLTYNSSTMTEWEFVAEVSKRTGCKILLDVNNIYVNAKNQKFDPKKYVDAIPREAIAEIHLAGFSDLGTFLFDTHSAPVAQDVWNLFQYTIESKGSEIPVLIEWDENIPEFSVLENEALKARAIMEGQ